METGQGNGKSLIYKLGIHEKALPGDLSWVERFESAKEAGFDFMEISIDGSDERIARLDNIYLQAEEITRASDLTGFSVGSISVSALRRFALGSIDKSKRERGMNIAVKAVDLASLLGCRILQIAGLDVCYEESTVYTQNFFLDNLKVLANYAASERTLIGVEPMEKDFMDNVSKAMDYILKVRSPYLGIYPDSGGLAASALKNNDDAIMDLKKGEGHILALHLQEFSEEIRGFVPVGSGAVDFGSFVKVGIELGTRCFVVEYVCPPNLDWRREMSRCCKFLREKIKG